MTAGIIGATGYAGSELARLLASHPKIDNMLLSSVSFEGGQFDEVYSNFFKRISLPLLPADEVMQKSDIVFTALPHGVGENYAKACIEKKIPCVDLSADFRFDDDEATYAAWYGKPYQYPELRNYSVYGLPELNRNRIRQLAASGRVIIGNPGCYPTGASLGAFPALAKGLFDSQRTIIVNSVSGISGGGRQPARSFHYPECADSVAPYKIGSHRHSPEIERNFSKLASQGNCQAINRREPSVIFTPHLAPINRGILSTIYIPLAAEWQAQDKEKNEDLLKKMHAVYADFFCNEPFVRVLPLGVTSATNKVRQSNYCDISLHLDIHGSTLIIASAIDNMVKGAAGQAIQNMNLLFNFKETDGLLMLPAVF
ncbi:MAG: N-acetyl-gamma-glutamyl-phosphate reductase [Treponema sp.]|nr:N-acetyl-gamma-glutamyl-phosphate reductase [Treponema sp.]